MNIWLWLHKKIEKSIRERDNCLEGSNCKPMKETLCVDDGPNHNNVIAMKMYPAIGGYMVEFMSYDNKQDRQKIERHIISDSGDVTTQVAQAIQHKLLSS